jgi:phosphoglycolate phosphatase
MSSLRLVVFDCDGTLVDSQHIICSAMISAFSTAGLVPPDPLKIRRVVGLSLVEAVAALIPDSGEDMHIQVADFYKTAFRGLVEREQANEPLYPGVLEALQSLADAGYVMGVATGKGRRGLLRVLERHDLGDYFITLQTADDAPGKPHPQMVLQAMAEAGSRPEDTIVVGDTSFDMAMARAAKTAAVGVSWGYHERGELLAHGAKEVIGSYHELFPLVTRMMAT